MKSAIRILMLAIATIESTALGAQLPGDRLPAAPPASLGAPGMVSQQPATNSLPAAVAEAHPNSKLVFALANDASLNSIGMASEDRLCAVGDRGVMLVSDNAGHTWQQLPAITTCNLYAVAFHGNLGLAVGGLVGTRVGISQGVALRSEDGGQSWSVANSTPLSRLRGVQFVGDRWLAWGDFHPALQTSIVESVDGGSTWRGVAADIGHATAAAWTRQDNGLIVDSLGRCFRTSLKLSQEAISANLAIHKVLYDGQRWWACGSHGTCLVSVDGLTWEHAPLPLSAAARDCVDFRAMMQWEDQLWLVGDPGSVLFRSVDRGNTWQRVETGQALPIHDVQFIDRNRGWMVGAQGAIWATRDGGLTWFSQRRRGERVSLLAAFERAERIPWSPLIATIWEEQLPVATLAMHNGEPLERTNFVVDANSRIACLAPQAGVASHSAWSSPASNTTQATHRLAIALRTWRPDVLLGEEQPGKHLADRHWSHRHVAADLQAAIQLAASTDNDLAIAHELSLPAWSVSKLAVLTQAALSEYSENSSRVLKSLGLTIWDVMLHLPIENVRADSTVSMRTVWSHSQASVVRASLMGGIVRSPEVARPPLEHALGNYQLVMGRVHRLRSLEQLVEQPQLSTSPERWQEEFNFLLKTLPDTEIGWLLAEQARNALRHGRFDRHRMLLQAIVARQPSEDASEWAKWELLRLSSSDEFQAWRDVVESQASTTVQFAGGASRGTTFAPPASPFDEPAVAATDPRAPRADLPVVAASAIQVIAEDLVAGNNELDGSGTPAAAAEQQRATRWLQELNAFASQSPYILSRPDCKLLFGKNLGQVGNLPGQQMQLESLLQQPWMVGWGRAARQEMLIRTNRVSELKWVAFADYANQPPILDGKLDEACWSRVPRMRLQRFEPGEEDAIRQPATIAWSYDSDYLYIGLECPRRSTRKVPLAKNRIYDADLSQLDHCTLLLDTDRDYATAVELSVAENGQTHDSCCGYASYNPRWHVSVDSQAEKWSAEVAIPLEALTRQSSITGQAWGVSAYRFSPLAEAESWSQLKTHRPSLEANGLLLFVPAMK